MLRHTTVRVIKAPLDVCVRCLMDPEKFFGASRYTYFARKVEGGACEVVFKWRKLGVTRYYRVKLKASRAGPGRVIYESTGDSDYYMRFEFNLEETDEGTLVKVSSEMRAGLMADILGRRDYSSFVEELVDKGLVSLAKNLAGAFKVQESPGGSVSCTRCLLYDPSTGRCLVLGVRVANESQPPCGGRDFIDAEELRKRVLGES